MASLAAAIVNLSALWKIIVAALAGGAGVAIMFGVLLLGLSRAGKSTVPSSKAFNYTLSGLAAVFCIGAVVLGVYAMAKKPSSSKPKPKKSAAVLVVQKRPDRLLA